MLGSLRRADSWRSGCRKVLVWPERREHDAGQSNTFFASWEIRLCFTIQVFFSFRCFFKESGLASQQDHDRKLLCGRLARGFVSSLVAGEDSWSPPGSFFDPLGSSGAPLGLHASVSCVIAGEDSWNPLGPYSGPPPLPPCDSPGPYSFS